MLYRLSHQFRIDATGRPLPAAPITEASAHYRAGRPEDAASCCRLIIARDPRHFDALHLLGVIHSDLGDHAAALDWLTRAEAVRPDVARLQYHIGNVLMAEARHTEAEIRFRRAMALDASLVGALNNLGSTLRSQDRDTEAIEFFRRALALRPGWPPALFNLGVSQARLGRFDDAVARFRAALAMPGDSPTEKLAEVHDALAQALMALQQHEAALEVCRARCALTPGDARAEWHHALALLTLGRFAEGLKLYERRWELPAFREGDAARLPPPRAPELAEMDGKRVLLRAEQGRGDVIQFCRYAPLVARRAATVALAVPTDLVALMRTLPGVDVVPDDADAEPDHDISAALLSLPLMFDTDAASIPAAVPYLCAPAERLAIWRERIGPAGGPRVGICWWGSQHIPGRSLPVGDLRPLVVVPGLAFHAVQKEITDPDRSWLGEHADVALHDAALHDFADTAALLTLMDLVVTVDTAVAHLAGALGRPTWIMLRRDADWRWLAGRDDSPWYPTARLFRQSASGGWPPVVAAVRAGLERRLIGPA